MTAVGIIASAVNIAAYHPAWPGATPTVVADNSDYELGQCISATGGVVIYGLRIWNPGLGNRVGRTGKLWEHAGTSWSTTPTQVRSVNLPTTMAAGWSEHLFGSTFTVTAGQVLKISYDVGASGGQNDYGATLNAVNSADVISADGKVTFASGGGVYNDIVNLNPNNFTPHFFGVDVLYV